MGGIILGNKKDGDSKKRNSLEKNKAEKELEDIFKFSGALVCIADIKGYFKKLSPAWSNLLGYSEKVLMSKPFLDFVHPDDKAKTEHIIKEELRKGKEVIHFENRYRCKDGPYRWLDWVSRPILEKGLVYAVAHDITEQKKYENDLQNTVASLNQAEEISQFGFFERNWQTGEGYWSKGFHKLLGLKENEIDCTHANFMDFLHEEDAGRVTKHIKNSLKNKTLMDVEFRIVQKGGQVLHIHGVASNYYDADGRPLLTRGTFQDISKSKESDKILKERYSFEKIISNLSSSLINLEEFDKAIFSALKALLELRNIDRAYIFKISENGELMQNTHEVCAQRVKPQIKNLQRVETKSLPWWMRQLRLNKVIHITDTDKLPPKRSNLKKILKSQDIKSLLVFPININEKLYGFIGFDNIKEKGRWSLHDIEILRTLADIIGRALEKNKAEEALKNKSDFDDLLNDLSLSFISSSGKGMDKKINEALMKIGNFYGADRSYIFSVSGNIISNTYEWCKKDIRFQIDNLQNIDASKELPWFLKEIKQLKPFVVESVAKLPSKAKLEKEHFEMQDIRSLLAVPILSGRSLIGFLGCDLVGHEEKFDDVMKKELLNLSNVFSNLFENIETEKELKERESILKSLFLEANDAIFIADPETGQIVDCNNMAVKMTGFSKKHLLSMTVDKLHPELVRKKTMDDFKKHAKGDLSLIESLLVRKTGSPIPVTINPNIIKRNNKNYLQGIFRDVSEQKKVEQELVEKESFLQNIFNSVQSGISILDKNFNIIKVNSFMKQMYGQDIVGKKCYEAYQKKDSRCPFCPSIKTLRTGKKNVEIVPYPCAKDADGYIELSSYPLKDSKGKITGVIEVVEDITKKVEAENELIKSKELLDFSITQSPVPVIVASAPDVEILFYNKQAKDLLEKKPKDVKDIKLSKHRDFWPTFYPDGTPYKVDDLPLTQAAKKGRVIKNKEIIVRKKDGDHWILASAAPLKDKKGKIIAGIMTFPEITEKKKTEKRLDSTQRKYKELYESSRDAIMTLKPPTWNFTGGNPATIQLFNCKDEKELVSLGPWNVSPKTQPDGKPSADKAKSLILKAMKEGSILFEWTHCTVDGKEFPATVLLTRLELEKGKPFLQATVRDISKQKEAEKEAHESYKIISQSPVVAFLWKNKSGWPVEYVSENVEGLLGYSDDEFISGKTLFEKTIHPDDLGRVGKELEEYNKKGIDDFSQVYRIITKDNKVKWVDDRTWVRKDSQGNITHYQGVLIDITEKKKIEDDFRKRSEELEKFNRFAIDREIKMIELKREINRLCKKIGKKKRYKEDEKS